MLIMPALRPIMLPPQLRLTSPHVNRAYAASGNVFAATAIDITTCQAHVLRVAVAHLRWRNDRPRCPRLYAECAVSATGRPSSANGHLRSGVTKDPSLPPLGPAHAQRL